ncbi:MAG: arsinothricin resistance N-acetyltransferase ArsN1 family B [Burkholderiaceae bacterium]
MIRVATVADAPAICQIYNHFVLHSTATFEEVAIDADEMTRRIDAILPRLPFLVAEIDGALAGYAYAAPWKPRSAYRHTVESSVYIAPGCAGMGLGTRLYQALLQALRERGVHAVLAGIVLPNEASVALHEAFGFCAVGRMREVGRKFDQWLDVGYWECLLAQPAQRLGNDAGP